MVGGRKKGKFTLEESESETCREDRVVVAVEVNRVSNRVAGAVWVHQEHFYHLGNRENLG